MRVPLPWAALTLLQGGNMPAHYAHYVFGSKVTRKLPGEIKEIINRDSDSVDAYLLGFQGPDPLAFYKPWFPNEINREGNMIHDRSGRFFFARALVYQHEEPCNARCAYLLGFMCHYMLDSACHPLVTRYMAKEGVTHALVEREFDTTLIEKNGKDPRGLDLSVVVPTNKDLGEIISPLYHSAGSTRMQESIVSMKRILDLMASPDDGFRRRAFKVMSRIPATRDHADMIVRDQMTPYTRESSKALEERLENTVDPCVREMGSLLESMKEGKPLSKRLSLNFLGRSV